MNLEPSVPLHNSNHKMQAGAKHHNSATNESRSLTALNLPSRVSTQSIGYLSSGAEPGEQSDIEKQLREHLRLILAVSDPLEDPEFDVGRLASEFGLDVDRAVHIVMQERDRPVSRISAPKSHPNATGNGATHHNSSHKEYIPSDPNAPITRPSQRLARSIVRDLCLELNLPEPTLGEAEQGQEPGLSGALENHSDQLAETTRALARALHTLSPPLRTAVSLRLSGMSSYEVSMLRGLPKIEVERASEQLKSIFLRFHSIASDGATDSPRTVNETRAEGGKYEGTGGLCRLVEKILNPKSKVQAK